MNASDGLVESKKVNKPLSLQARDAIQTPSFQLVSLVPFGAFLALELLYTFGFLMIPSICILVSVFAALGSIWLMLMSSRGALFGPIGVGCFLAVAVGTLLGLFFYDQYAIFPMFYRHAAIYANVVPTQPSTAVADAGKIMFTAESYVDTNRSVGFITEAGSTYCAAPVRDGNPLTRVEFWAVGINCCNDLGRFRCDAAETSSAHSGIVVFDNNGFFTSSRHDYYDKARLKAEAQHGLFSRPRPLYVRWVASDNLGMLERYYRVQVAVVLVVATILYLALSCGLAFAWHKPGARVPIR